MPDKFEPEKDAAGEGRGHQVPADGQSRARRRSTVQHKKESFRDLEDLALAFITPGSRGVPERKTNWDKWRFENFDAEDFPRILRLAERPTAQARRGSEASSNTTDSHDAGIRSPRVAAPNPAPVPSQMPPSLSVPAQENSEVDLYLPARPMYNPATGTNNARDNASRPRRETTLGEQLLMRQKREADRLTECGNYDGADEMMKDILENASLPANQRPKWILGRALCLQMLGNWQKSLELLGEYQIINENVPAPVGFVAMDYAKAAFYAAEAHFHLGDYEKARRNGSIALQEFESEKHRGHPATGACIERAVELMARTTAVMGKKFEEEFYRPKVVAGSISKQHMRAEMRSRIDRRNEFLRRWDLSCTFNFEDDRCHICGTDENFMRAFKVSLMGLWSTITDPKRRQYLLRLLLLDDTILFRKDIQFDNKTPLYYAIYYNNRDCVTSLINLGVDPNGPIIEPIGEVVCYPLQPLAVAARLGHKGIVDVLLRHKASINGDTRSEPLLQLDADVQLNLAGTTPLHEAVLYGNHDIAETLLNSGAEVDVFARSPYLNEDSVTPLHVAAANGHLSIVRLLLDRGASVDRRTYELGNTVLHLAATGADPSVLRMLLGRGANVNEVNHQGQTPLDYVHTMSTRLHDSTTINGLRNVDGNSAILVAMGGVFSILGDRRRSSTSTRRVAGGGI